jgi:hypothetical protein
MANGTEQPELTGLINALTRGGLGETQVNELVDVIAQLRGGRRVRAFPKGQFGPDSVEIQTVFEPDELGSLLDVLRESPRIDSVEIFPRVIINPEVFSVRIGLR